MERTLSPVIYNGRWISAVDFSHPESFLAAYYHSEKAINIPFQLQFSIELLSFLSLGERSNAFAILKCVIQLYLLESAIACQKVPPVRQVRTEDSWILQGRR